MGAFYGWVATKCECDGPGVLQKRHPIRFLVLELHMLDRAIELAQEGFVREPLRAHGHDGSRSMTQGPKETFFLPQPVDFFGREQLKEAQRNVGEYLWLSGRTRPTLFSAYNTMSGL